MSKQNTDINRANPQGLPLAVIVTFNPNIFPHQIIRLLCQHFSVLVVDNSTNNDTAKNIAERCALSHTDYISMDGNQGIAKAQNEAIRFAREHKFDSIAFFDQDTIVGDTALKTLAQSISDTKDAVFYLRPTKRFSITRPANRTELMSSGSGCALTVFEQVGEFESDLFIDCVDFEWGWRCQRMSIPLIDIECDDFQHKLGSSHFTIFKLTAHFDNPIRLYYQYRNIILMLRRSYVPIRWKLSQLLRSCIKVALIIAIADQKRNRLAKVTAGIVDGLCGRTGRYKGEEL